MPRLRVALVGAGLIGRSWAVVFVRAGCEVSLYDHDSDQTDRALDWIEATLQSLATESLVEDASWLRSLVSPAPTLAEALIDADYVQESVLEDLDVKKRLLVDIDRLTPIDAIIASSTSAFIPSLLYAELPGRHRCLVAHPMNPPHLTPVVEICGATFTYPETLDRARKLLRLGGQIPVDVKREIDGFILNRLQHAVLSEALRLVGEGYVSPQDLDETVKNGLAMRWSFMGPLETIDLNAPGGIADYLTRYGATIRRIADDICRCGPWPDSVAAALHQELRRKVPLDQLGAEARWRDKRMMALANHKRQAVERFGK